MGNTNYTVEDFVLDLEFRKWILAADYESNIHWEKFLKENPACRDDILAARRIILFLEQKQSQSEGLANQDRAEIWSHIESGIRMKAAIDEEEALVVPISSEAILNKQGDKVTRGYPWLKFAAILVLVLGIGMLWLFFGHHQQQTPIVDSWQEHETAFGVKSIITLSDGSVAILNSGSRISYLENFRGPKREIFLEGEACFEVARDSLKPFVVQTAGLSTQALGTSFNIRAFRDERIEVALVSGLAEVKVQNGSKSELIIPGEGISSLPNGENWKRQKVSLEHVTAWMNKTIIFDNTPFLKAVNILENWYGVRIKLLRFEDETLKVSGKYKDETLNNILDGWSYGIRFDYAVNGKEVIIEFKR